MIRLEHWSFFFTNLINKYSREIWLIIWLPRLFAKGIDNYWFGKNHSYKGFRIAANFLIKKHTFSVRKKKKKDHFSELTFFSVVILATLTTPTGHRLLITEFGFPIVFDICCKNNVIYYRINVKVVTFLFRSTRNYTNDSLTVLLQFNFSCFPKCYYKKKFLCVRKTNYNYFNGRPENVYRKYTCAPHKIL